MSNPKGRPQLDAAHKRRTHRRGNREYHWRSKRSYFEQVLIANGLWNPGRVKRT